jgi:RNA polymerase sigma-70 factor (ECF subfamily)
MGDGPEKQAITSETRRKVQAAIAKLPPDMRMAVILRDIQGLSGKEAAEALGIEVSTLKTRLHRGRMKLRDLLQEYVDGAED